MIKAIIFDFDGVLVESVDIKTKAFAKLFENEGENIVKEVVDYHVSHTGVSRFDKFKYFYEHFLNKPLTDKIFNELCDRFSTLVMDEVVKAPYVAGAREFLETYSHMYRCYVTSATPQQEIEEIVRRRAMDRYFVKVYGAPSKKTDCVAEIMTINNLKPNEAVYVGDAKSDHEAAKSNSVAFVARVSEPDKVFNGISCKKVLNLVDFNSIVQTLSQ